MESDGLKLKNRKMFGNAPSKTYSPGRKHNSSLFLFPATFKSAQEFLIPSYNELELNNNHNLLLSENESVQNHSDNNELQVPSELNESLIVDNPNSVNVQENPQNQRCQTNQNMESNGNFALVESTKGLTEGLKKTFN